MAYWQIGLIALAVVWVLQAIGTWMQMRHYRLVMGGVAERWKDGFVGAGNARGRLGKGVIVVLVVDGGDVIRQFLAMEGRSVFAKFKAIPDFDGKSLDVLRDGEAIARFGPGHVGAVKMAIEQIDRARGRAAAASAPAALQAG